MKLTYQDGNGEQSLRRVHPLAIWSFTDGWMFAAWCELRAGFRTFRIDRILAIEPTGEQFADNEAQDLRAYIASENSC